MKRYPPGMPMVSFTAWMFVVGGAPFEGFGVSGAWWARDTGRLPDRVRARDGLLRGNHVNLHRPAQKCVRHEPAEQKIRVGHRHRVGPRRQPAGHRGRLHRRGLRRSPDRGSLLDDDSRQRWERLR